MVIGGEVPGSHCVSHGQIDNWLILILVCIHANTCVCMLVIGEGNWSVTGCYFNYLLTNNDLQEVKATADKTGRQLANRWGISSLETLLQTVGGLPLCSHQHYMSYNTTGIVTCGVVLHNITCAILLSALHVPFSCQHYMCYSPVSITCFIFQSVSHMRCSCQHNLWYAHIGIICVHLRGCYDNNEYVDNRGLVFKESVLPLDTITSKYNVILKQNNAKCHIRIMLSCTVTTYLVLAGGVTTRCSSATYHTT